MYEPLLTRFMVIGEPLFQWAVDDFHHNLDYENPRSIPDDTTDGPAFGY